MSERGKKWIFWGSLIMFILSIAGLIISGMVKYSDVVDKIQMILPFIMIISILNLAVLFSVKFQERKWLKKFAGISVFPLIPISLGLFIAIHYWDDFPIWLGMIWIILIGLLIILTHIYIFVLREPGELKWVLIFLSLIVLSIILQRIKFPISIIENLFLPGFIVLTSVGLYMFGFRCIFFIEKNGYLKTVSFISCTLTSFGSLFFLLKIQGEKIENLELFYFIPAFLMTLVVLLSLPISGYIQWSSVHKRILKKVAISCVFFLIIFSIRFVYPDFFKQVIFKQDKEFPEFFLNDYNIPDKNGLF